MSPGFRLRPSLSELALGGDRHYETGVAGVQAPAFVERPRSWTFRCMIPSCVAGVQAPAFVERLPPRSSRARFRRVAGVQAPAFVERR